MSISSQIGCIFVRAGMKHEKDDLREEAAKYLAKKLNCILHGDHYLALVTERHFIPCVSLGSIHIYTYHDGRVWSRDAAGRQAEGDELIQQIELMHDEARLSPARKFCVEGDAARMGVTVQQLLHANATMGFDYIPWSEDRYANPNHTLLQSDRAVQQYNNPCARNARNMHPHLRNQDGSDQHMSDRQIAGMYYRADKFAYEQMYKRRGGGGESNLSTVYGL